MSVPRSILDFGGRWSGAAWNWVRYSPHAGMISLLVALGVIALCIVGGYHENFMPQPPSPMDIPKGWEPPADGVYLTLYLLAYLRLFVLVGGVVYHVYIIRAYPDVRKMIRPTWIA